jgi:hypothetical protein
MLLFDLEKNPAESIGLPGEYPKIKEGMIRKYHQFLNGLNKWDYVFSSQTINILVYREQGHPYFRVRPRHS